MQLEKRRENEGCVMFSGFTERRADQGSRQNDEIKLRNNILKLKEVFKDKPPEPDVHSFNLRIVSTDSWRVSPY